MRTILVLSIQILFLVGCFADQDPTPAEKSQEALGFIRQLDLQGLPDYVKYRHQGENPIRYTEDFGVSSTIEINGTFSFVTLEGKPLGRELRVTNKVRFFRRTPAAEIGHRLRSFTTCFLIDEYASLRDDAVFALWGDVTTLEGLAILGPYGPEELKLIEAEIQIGASVE